jgi:hypothetical protein
MLHSSQLQKIVVTMPGMTKQLGKCVIEFMHQHSCQCSACRALLKLMRDPPVAEFCVSFTSANQVLQALRTQRNDYSLEIAMRICNAIGYSIEQCTLPSNVLHQLEQAHAFTREQLRADRIRHCFERLFLSVGIEPGDRFSRLVDAVRLEIYSNSFPILDESGFHFDNHLRVKIAAMAENLMQNIR